MIISDGYGGIIHLNVEDYLDMTDLQWQEIIAMGKSTMVDDPFYNSFVDGSIKKQSLIDMLEDETEDILEEEDILIIPIEEIDLDILEDGNDI